MSSIISVTAASILWRCCWIILLVNNQFPVPNNRFRNIKINAGSVFFVIRISDEPTQLLFSRLAVYRYRSSSLFFQLAWILWIFITKY